MLPLRLLGVRFARQLYTFDQLQFVIADPMNPFQGAALWRRLFGRNKHTATIHSSTNKWQKNLEMQEITLKLNAKTDLVARCP